MSPWPQLRGRHRESEFLSTLATDVRAARSRAVVIRGEAGIGKTALLQLLVRRADGCRFIRAAGVESEMNLPFAALHQLCGPFLDRLDSLPPPQCDALRTTFGFQAGRPSDRFLVGLAVLTLLSEVAEEQPTICVVDDAQWLDEESAQILGFVARRLAARRLALVFAVREGAGDPILTGLPELVVRGLSRRDAAGLLKSAVPGRLDEAVCDRILAESHGNPLALLELPRQSSSTELNFGPIRAPSQGSSLIGRLEQGFLHQCGLLSEGSQRLMLLAAAEPLGDVPLLWRAMENLGIEAAAVMAAETAGLLEMRDRVRFRHPLVRSAVYGAASPEQRRVVHEALAEVTDPVADPDRRAWHRARAASSPDEAVAGDLVRAGGRALSRGGLAAAAACLEAAAGLTPDRCLRTRRSLDAAQAKVTAGAFEDASALLAWAVAGPLSQAERARVELLRAQIAHHSHHGNEALPMLLSAARRLEGIDSEIARATYLDALAAAMFAGRLTRDPAVGMRQVAEAVRKMQLPPTPGKSDLHLRDIAVLYTEGYAAAAPGLRRTVDAFGTDDLTVDETVRCAWLASCAATDLWDDVNWDVVTRRHLEGIREVGALSALPLALNSRAIYLLLSGDLAEAESLVAETAWLAEITAGQNAMLPYGDVCLSAMRGDASRAEPQMNGLLDEVVIRGEGVGLNMVSWFQAMLYNGLGRFPDAMDAAQVAAAAPLELGPPKWALGELIEAAVHSGSTDAAACALEQLSGFAQASGTELALGIEAGRKALLCSGQAAERMHREAIERLERTTIRVELARTRLRYGEWLRREGRRADARGQLRKAYESLAAMGVAGFAERARMELAATGESVTRNSEATTADLTAQEAHIARLAAVGLTNQEIGAELYISARTVEWHLRKVFVKFGVNNRRQLRQSLSDLIEAAAG